MSYKNSHEQERFQETQWISVNDRLPECIDKYGISKIVLCLDARGRAGFGIYQNGEKQLYHEGWFTGGRSWRKLRKNYPLDTHTSTPKKRY